MATRKKSKRYIGIYIQELQNGDKSYYITYKENKKDVWKKIGRHSEGIREAYCNEKRNEIITKMRLGEDLPYIAVKNTSITFLDITQKFYDYKSSFNKENNKTRSRVEKRIKTHYIGFKVIKLVTKADIEHLQKELKKDLMPATVNFIIEQIGSIFNWAIEHEIISRNPVKGIKKFKVDNSRLRYLNLEEIKRLKETVITDKSLYYFVILGLSTGGRLQTLCNIKPIDFKGDGTIRLYDFKNESEYYGFISDDLQNELYKFISKLDIKKDTYLFKNTKNHNYTNQYYYRKLQPIFNILFNPEGTKKLERVTIHTLRHTFASNLAINETPILTIKKLMNHNDINATMRYAKLSKSSGEKHVNNFIKSFMD